MRIARGLGTSLLLAGLAAAALASAPAARAEATAAAPDHQTLARQAQAWDEAIVRKDRAAIEANMADDFRQIDSNGTIESRATFVEGLISPRLTIDPYTVEDFEIRQYGDVALLSGRTRMTGRFDGEPFTTHYRYIDVYVRRAGVWKVVSVQTTRVREEGGG